MKRTTLTHIVVLAMTLTALAASAATPASVVRTVTIPTPSERKGVVSIPGGMVTGPAGAPALPVRTVRLVLPPGTRALPEDVTVEVLETAPWVPSEPLAPIPHQVPLCCEGSAPARPDPAIYGRDALYPTTWYRFAGIGHASGYPVVQIELYPVRWNPVSGDALAARRIRIRVSPRAVPGMRRDLLEPRSSRWDRERLARLVDNPLDLGRFPQPRPKGARAGDWQFLVVTSSNFASAFQPLLDHRSAADGMTTHLVTVSDVLAGSNGRDDAEKLRNFLADAWANHGTRYVVLGGDSGIVPFRGAYGRAEVTIVDDAIPADLYFACLDGDWNADGDSTWGEVEDGVDLLPELAVGRIAADTVAEVEHQVAKILAYEAWSEAPFSALLVGESLDDTPSWGGDMLDWLVPEMGGIATERLYDRDGGSWSGSTLVGDYLDTGTLNLVHHVGHANTTTVMRLGLSDAASLTNDNPFFIFSHGCYPGSFDLGRCMAEAFTVEGSGGCFAVVMNSRYGWYTPGSVLGTTNLFHRRFVEAIHESHVTRLGDALNVAKAAMAPAAGEDGSVRWSEYDITLFGDPATRLHWQCDAGAIRLVPESPPHGFRVMAGDRWAVHAAVHTDCSGAVPDGTTVTVTPSPGEGSIALHDDGVAPDAVADDGHFSGWWTPPAEGPVVLEFSAETPDRATAAASASGLVVPYQAYEARAVASPWIDTSPGTVLDESTLLGTTDDGGWIVPIGFPFRLYGAPYDDLLVQINGMLHLAHPGRYASTEESFPVPFPDDDNGLVAPLWCDLELGASGTVRTLLTGTEPSRVFTVEWHGVDHVDGASPGTFQASLYEGSNEIVLRWQDTDFGDARFDHGADASVGIEGHQGVHGLQVFDHEPGLTDGTALLLTPVLSTGRIRIPGGLVSCSGSLSLEVTDADLDGQPSVQVTVASDTEPGGETVTLTPGADGRIFTGSIALAGGTATGNGTLEVHDGDHVTATYTDGSPAGERTATARVDCIPPVISNLELVPGPHEVTVRWTTDEPSSGAVRWGTGVPQTEVPEGGSPSTAHAVTVAGLEPCTAYRFAAVARDGAGNEAVDDGAGHLARTTGWTGVLAGGALDTNPGWTVVNDGATNGWAFGRPAGTGGDPAAGFDGENVYGVNLGGAYDANLPQPITLTTPSLDCSNLQTVELAFQRWLGIESSQWDHASIGLQVDGGAWETVWENPGSTIQDTAWHAVTFDLTAAAAGHADVRIRWTLGPTDGSVQYAGWNLDEITVGGASECPACLDPPVWQGTGGILTADPVQAAVAGLDLAWDTADPHCGDTVTYELWVERGTTLDWSAAPVRTGLHGTALRLLGLAGNTAYTVGVRARDAEGNLTANTGTLTVTTPDRPAAGDADCDGILEPSDLPVLVGVLFGTGPDTCAGLDADASGTLDAADPAALIAHLDAALF